MSGSRSSTSKTRSKLTSALAISTCALASAVSGEYSRVNSSASATIEPVCRCPPIASTPPSPYTRASASADISVSEFMKTDCSIEVRTPMSRTRPARTSNSRDSVAGLPNSFTNVAPGAEKRSVICVFIVALWMAASRDNRAMVRPIHRAGSRNSGIRTSDSSVTCHEILSMTTRVSVSVTTLVITPEKVSEKARCAPITSLPSLLTRAPVRVRVKNATGIRCTWSNTAVRRSRIRPSPIVDDSQRVHQRDAGLGDGDRRNHRGQCDDDADCAVADLVDHPARQKWRGQAEQRADHADHDEHAQPAMMPRREAPDPAKQPAVDQRPQIAALGVRLPVQGLPRYRLKAHIVTVKPQQWMRSTTSRGVATSNSMADPREVRLDFGDPRWIDAPGLLAHRRACRDPRGRTARPARRPSTRR